MKDKDCTHYNVTITKIFSYDLVASPAFPNAKLHIPINNYTRKFKIKKILFKIKKPLI